MLTFIFLVLSVLFTLIIFKLIGSFLIQIFNETGLFRESSFLHVVTGVTFTSLLYSVIVSDFKSLYTIPFLFILSVISFYSVRNMKKMKFRLNEFNVKKVFLPVFTLSLLFSFLLLPFSDSIYVVGHDYALYGYFSHYLSFYGIENLSGVFNNSTEFVNSTSVYHYLELWLISMVSKFSGIHNYIITHAYMQILSLVVAYLFIEELFDKLTFRNRIVLILLLISSLFVLPQFKDYNLLQSTYNLGQQSFWTFPKYFFILIVFLSYLKFKYNNLKYAEGVFLTLPFFHTGTTALAFVILVFLTLIKFRDEYKHLSTTSDIKGIRRGIYNTLMSKAMLRMLSILFAYLILSMLVIMYYSSKDKFTNNIFEFSELLSLSYLKTLASLSVKTIIDSIIVISPFGLFIYFNKRKLKEVKGIMDFKIILSFLISGFITYVGFNYVTNQAYQFYYYVFFTILPIYLVYCIFQIYMSSVKSIQLLSIFMFMAYGLFSFYTTQLSFNKEYVKKTFLLEIKKEFSKRDLLNKPGAIFFKDDFNNTRLIRNTQGYEVLGMAHPGLFYSRFSELPDLSHLSGPILKDIEAFENSLNPYSVYCQEKNLEKDYAKESILSAFKHYKVYWIIEGDNSFVPSYIEPLIEYSIIDQKRKTTIHFLRQ